MFKRKNKQGGCPLFDAYIEEAGPQRYGSSLSESKAAKQILDSSPEDQRAVLFAAIVWIEGNSSRKHFSPYSGEGYRVHELLCRLLQRKLPLSQDDLMKLLDRATKRSTFTPVGYVLRSVERHLKDNALDEPMRASLAAVEKAVQRQYYSPAEKTKLSRRISAMLGEEDQVPPLKLDTDEPWAARLLTELEQLTDENQAAMHRLLYEASCVSGSKPAKKWQKMTAELASGIDDELIRACLTVWVTHYDQPRDQPPTGGYYESSVWYAADANADMMKGLLWLSPSYADKSLIRAIASAGLSGQRKIPGFGPRSTKVTNAAVWALSAIDDPLAIGQLAILRAKIKNKATQKQIDKAMNAIAERIGVSPEEVEEMAVPTCGLTEVGRCLQPMGEFTAELVLAGTNATELRWIKPDGKPQKTVPKAVKENFADDLRDLKAAAKDIQKILPAQRDRIDRLFLDQKTWAYETWAERYLNHPLVGTLARRIIWGFDHGGTKVYGTWLNDQLVDAHGKPISIDPDKTTVSLWHPIGHSEEQISDWRAFFETHQIKQPFKQAHREVYLLTDAERNTNVYSNRYASHILKQHQYNALCAARGWRNALRLMVDDEVPATSRSMPAYGLRAEFWVEGAGDEYGQDTNETGTFLYLATDQVRFYPIDAPENWGHACGGGFGAATWRGANNAAAVEPTPLDQIDPLVLSEIMRDVDLFVGVASVGNDPNWQDGGPEGRYQDYWQSYSFGDLGATAQTRKAILERLVPRLKIADRCSFDDKFLIVRGDERTYKIHLGSSNILMEPNDQYLCIVPGRGDAKAGDKVFLPFEGDQRLAVILSKAMMLADDTKIKDTTILSQIKR